MSSLFGSSHPFILPSEAMVRCLISCSEHVGHLNPTLPVVKALVDLGHEVHFLCLEMAQKKVEEVGAIFHNTVAVQTELYAGRDSGKLAVYSIMEELGLEMSFLNILKCLNVSLELELPGTMRFLQQLKPDVLVYDPLITSRAAPLAAEVLGIPCVGLLTLAGPGAMRCHGPALLGEMTLEEAGKEVKQFSPHTAATKRIYSKHNLALEKTHLLPDGYLDTCRNTVLVTTSEELQDPVTEPLAMAYERDGTRFVFVGPLLMPSVPGALDANPLIQQMREARKAGKRIVLVSMGTVITGGDKVAGSDADCNGRSITGRDLCRAVWSATFDACGEDFLVITALGLQADPLGDIEVPSGAVCAPSFRQVDLLRAGVDVFVTHGGQNSFTEALASGAPVLVCPGFGDQVVNAEKAVVLGVGLKVDRPSIATQDEAAKAAADYREDVRRSLREVLQNPAYQRAAEAQASKLKVCGGVPRAVHVILKTAREELVLSVAANAGA